MLFDLMKGKSMNKKILVLSPLLSSPVKILENTNKYNLHSSLEIALPSPKT